MGWPLSGHLRSGRGRGSARHLIDSMACACCGDEDPRWSAAQESTSSAMTTEPEAPFSGCRPSPDVVCADREKHEAVITCTIHASHVRRRHGGGAPRRGRRGSRRPGLVRPGLHPRRGARWWGSPHRRAPGRPPLGGGAPRAPPHRRAGRGPQAGTPPAPGGLVVTGVPGLIKGPSRCGAGHRADHEESERAVAPTADIRRPPRRGGEQSTPRRAGTVPAAHAHPDRHRPRTTDQHGRSAQPMAPATEGHPDLDRSGTPADHDVEAFEKAARP